MLYIVRHGQTDYNKEKRCQGHTNTALNEIGIKQAQNLHKKLKNVEFDKVFSSPLERAYKTAKIITDHEIIIDERLIERCNGIFEGKVKKEIDDFLKKIDNYNPKDYGIETLYELQQRANSFLDEILKKYKGENILIVSHGGLIFNMMCYLYGEPKEDDIKKYRLGNCEVLEYNNS